MDEIALKELLVLQQGRDIVGQLAQVELLFGEACELWQVRAHGIALAQLVGEETDQIGTGGRLKPASQMKGGNAFTCADRVPVAARHIQQVSGFDHELVNGIAGRFRWCGDVAERGVKARRPVDPPPLRPGELNDQIEIMTFIADHYRPDRLDSIVGVLGRHNIVAAAQYVLVIGGGSGTRDEVDMAFSLGLRVLPLPASGGTAARAYSMMSENPALRGRLDGERFAALRDCNDTEAFLRIIEHALTLSPGATT
jgi:hypothetical protein